MNRTRDGPLKRELASVWLARDSAQDIGSSNHAGGVNRTREEPLSELEGRAPPRPRSKINLNSLLIVSGGPAAAPPILFLAGCDGAAVVDLSPLGQV